MKRRASAKVGRLIAALLAFVVSADAARTEDTADQAAAAQMMDDLMYGRGTVGGPFTLTDQSGRKRSDSEFRGKLMIVYFGYTFCPDVCPGRPDGDHAGARRAGSRGQMASSRSSSPSIPNATPKYSPNMFRPFTKASSG